MDDENDVKKMNEVLQQNHSNNYDDEFQNFINNYQSDEDEVEEEQADPTLSESMLEDVQVADISKFNRDISCTALKIEEKFVIDACKDPELKNLLTLNRKKVLQLILLYKKVKDLLLECQSNIFGQCELIKKMVKENQTLKPTINLWKMGAPYFKDTCMYPCPSNSDMKKKIINNELSVYDITTTQKWTSFECDKLLNSVKLNYRLNKQKEISAKITSLQKLVEGGDYDVVEEMNALILELRDHKDEANSIIPPLNSDECIDWNRISEVFLKERHTSMECKTFWHIYLHPGINKSKWTTKENNTLRKLAKDHNLQNWDKIAEELNTNRSGFITCYHYFSNLDEKFKRGEFTREEDEQLKSLVNMYKEGNYIRWDKISQNFKARSRSQLFYRYTYYLAKSELKHGKFTVAEDVLLTFLVNKFGRNFTKCAQYFPGRSQIQLKARYNTNLRTELKKGSFTVKDDEMILEHVEKYGDKSWSGLVSKVQRCRGQLRQRYATIQQHLKDNPNKPLSSIPRRKYDRPREPGRSGEHKEQLQFIRRIADIFKDKPTPSLQEIQETLYENGLPLSDNESEAFPEDENETTLNIDDILVKYFCNSIKLEAPKPTSNFKKLVDDVRSLQNQLNVNLVLPINFKENCHLDVTDIGILQLLSDKYKSNNESQTISIPSGKSDINFFVPPNLSTLACLRSLLIKHILYRQEPKPSSNEILTITDRRPEISWGLERFLVQLTDYSKVKIQDERNLFFKRIFALLKWVSILTLQEPNASLVRTLLPVPRPQGFPRAPVKTYTRKQPQKRKIKQDPFDQPGRPLKLFPVDKKVVMDMLSKSKDVKFVSVGNKSDISNAIVVKTLNELPSTSQGSFSNIKIRVKDNLIEKQSSDVDDLKKLDIFLKSEVNNFDDSDSDSELVIGI